MQCKLKRALRCKWDGWIGEQPESMTLNPFRIGPAGICSPGSARARDGGRGRGPVRSFLTRRWRETDSNPQSHPTAGRRHIIRLTPTERDRRPTFRPVRGAPLHSHSDNRRPSGAWGWLTFPPFTFYPDVDQPTAANRLHQARRVLFTLASRALIGQEIMSSERSRFLDLAGPTVRRPAMLFFCEQTNAGEGIWLRASRRRNSVGNHYQATGGRANSVIAPLRRQWIYCHAGRIGRIGIPLRHFRLASMRRKHWNAEDVPAAPSTWRPSRAYAARRCVVG